MLLMRLPGYSYVRDSGPLLLGSTAIKVKTLSVVKGLSGFILGPAVTCSERRQVEGDGQPWYRSGLFPGMKTLFPKLFVS